MKAITAAQNFTNQIWANENTLLAKKLCDGINLVISGKSV